MNDLKGLTVLVGMEGMGGGVRSLVVDKFVFCIICVWVSSLFFLLFFFFVLFVFSRSFFSKF
jgi:hypothetical protein